MTKIYHRDRTEIPENVDNAPATIKPTTSGNRGPLPHHCPGSFSKTESTKKDKKLAMTQNTCLTGENTNNTKTPNAYHSTNQHTHICLISHTDELNRSVFFKVIRRAFPHEKRRLRCSYSIVLVSPSEDLERVISQKSVGLSRSEVNSNIDHFCFLV